MKAEVYNAFRSIHIDEATALAAAEALSDATDLQGDIDGLKTDVASIKATLAGMRVQLGINTAIGLGILGRLLFVH